MADDRLHISESLVDLVRRAFMVLPGIRLTIDEAQRMLHLDRLTTLWVLDGLVERNFLRIEAGQFFTWRFEGGATFSNGSRRDVAQPENG